MSVVLLLNHPNVTDSHIGSASYFSMHTDLIPIYINQYRVFSITDPIVGATLPLTSKHLVHHYNEAIYLHCLSTLYYGWPCINTWSHLVARETAS